MKWMSIVGLLAVATACERPAVVWQVPESTTLSMDADVYIDSSGHPGFVMADRVLPRVMPTQPTPCPRSIQIPEGPVPYAVWWSVRSDSSAGLYAAQWKGNAWSPPVVVDSDDAGSTGCNRPPPEAAEVGDNLYVAYSMEARE